MVSYLLLYIALVSCILKILYTGKVSFTHLYLVLVSFLLLYLALVFLTYSYTFHWPLSYSYILCWSPIYSYTLQWSLSYSFKGIKLFLFILIYVIAPSFLFPMCGHTLFNSRYFRFYEHLHRGHISKYM